MLKHLDEVTDKLLERLAPLSDDDVRRPSTLPGWTRGHILTHLARGSEALGNVLRDLPPYPSQEKRSADIEAGAGRSADELRADIRATAAGLREVIDAVPADGWERIVEFPGQPSFPKSDVIVRRINEIELHLVDLAIGYTPADWPAFYAGHELREPLRTWRADRLGSVTG